MTDYLFILSRKTNIKANIHKCNEISGNTDIATIFVDFKNNNTFFPRSLVINPTDKMDLKRSDASVAISDLSVCYTWNNMKHLYGNKKN